MQTLPTPTKDLQQLRHDLHERGFCLIEDGLSSEQCTRIRGRVADQAAAERALGTAYLAESQQHVWSLANKGAGFVGLPEHDPAAVQAWPDSSDCCTKPWTFATRGRAAERPTP